METTQHDSFVSHGGRLVLAGKKEIVNSLKSPLPSSSLFLSAASKTFRRRFRVSGFLLFAEKRLLLSSSFSRPYWKIRVLLPAKEESSATINN
jgi:hypothetical protein